MKEEEFLLWLLIVSLCPSPGHSGVAGLKSPAPLPNSPASTPGLPFDVCNNSRRAEWQDLIVLCIDDFKEFIQVHTASTMWTHDLSALNLNTNAGVEE